LQCLLHSLGYVLLIFPCNVLSLPVPAILFLVLLRSNYLTKTDID
jgi:hypothetical protein